MLESNEMKLSPKKKPIILGGGALLLLCVILVVGLAYYISEKNRSAAEKKLEQFNKTTVPIVLFQADSGVLPDQAQTKLQFDFAAPQQVLNLKLTLNIQNNTQLEYSPEILGSVDNINSYTTDAAIITLPAGSEQVIEFELPLRYSEQDGKISAYLKLPDKELKYEWVFRNKLLSEIEVVNTKVETTATNLSFSGSHKPLLPYVIEVKNQSAVPVTEAYYELYLVNNDNKQVQPMIVEALDLPAGSVKKLIGEFQFSIPPADLMKIAKGKYKLKLVVKGMVLDRKLNLEVISATSFDLEVKSY